MAKNHSQGQRAPLSATLDCVIDRKVYGQTRKGELAGEGLFL